MGLLVPALLAATGAGALWLGRDRSRIVVDVGPAEIEERAREEASRLEERTREEQSPRLRLRGLARPPDVTGPPDVPAAPEPTQEDLFARLLSLRERGLDDPTLLTQLAAARRRDREALGPLSAEALWFRLQEVLADGVRAAVGSRVRPTLERVRDMVDVLDEKLRVRNRPLLEALAKAVDLPHPLRIWFGEAPDRPLAPVQGTGSESLGSVLVRLTGDVSPTRIYGLGREPAPGAAHEPPFFVRMSRASSAPGGPA